MNHLQRRHAFSDRGEGACGPAPLSCSEPSRRVLLEVGQMKPALVVLALLATGCAANGYLLSPRPSGPDQEVVVSLVCRGEGALADRYLEDRGVDRAGRIERIERARNKCAPQEAGGAR